MWTVAALLAGASAFPEYAQPAASAEEKRYDAKYTGPEWDSRSAASKSAVLWGNCLANTNNVPHAGGTDLAELFTQDNSLSFESFSDDIPGQGGLFNRKRNKQIHRVGAVAETAFVSKGNHSYTGVFKGCDNAFIRLSAAAAPEPFEEPPKFVPGIGLKFLRDGVDSGNLLAMANLRGQSSWNMFAYDFTNHVPDIHFDISDPATEALRSRFYQTSDWPTMIGASDLATYTCGGDKEAKPVFPFRLIFQPAESLRKEFSFYDDVVVSDLYFYLKELEKLEASGDIYHVYAESEPYAEPEYIGDLTYKSNFGWTATKYGDENLFFRHQYWEEDVELKPEWEEAATEIQKKQRSTPFFQYDNLPYA